MKPTQTTTLEIEAMYYFQNNREHFNQLVRDGYFCSLDSTKWFEQIKSTAKQELEALEMKEQRQANLSLTPIFEITQQKQLDSEKEKNKENHLAKAIYKSILPSPFHMMFNY